MIKKIDNDSRHVRLLYKKDHDNLEKKTLKVQNWIKMNKKKQPESTQVNVIEM